MARWAAATCSRCRARAWSARCAGTDTGCGSWVKPCRRRWRGSVACGRGSWPCRTRRRWCCSGRARRRSRYRSRGSATRGWRWIGDEELMTTNTSDVVSAIRELTTTKQLERTELLDLLKDGLHAALVKRYGPNVRAEIGIDEMKGSIRIVVLKTVVEAVEDPGTQVSLEEARYEDPEFAPGDVLEEEVPFEQFGRTAVQAAKQRIIQRVREGERSRIREEFSGKVGELLSGEVQQIERGKIVVMLNKFREAEAIIPYRDQNHREHFHQGDTIRAVLKRIEETPKGPRLILSRADPLFVKALFKLEVPEIQQQIVEIRATAREAGSRTKIAVWSRDDSIDPVGACVGLKGSRVQAVVNELNGERIDIVPWSSDPERFAKLSLAPARGARVLGSGIENDPGDRGRGSAVARHRPQRSERAARVRADRLESRPLLEPRVAGARRGRSAVRPVAAGRPVGDAGGTHRDERLVAGAGASPRAGREKDAPGHSGPGARGRRSDPRHDRRPRGQDDVVPERDDRGR